MSRNRVAASIVAMLMVGCLSVAHAESHKEGKEMKESKATSMKDDSALLEKLVATETSIWNAFKNKDAATFQSLVSKDAWAIDPSGMADVNSSVAMMNDYSVESFSIENTKLMHVTKDVVILTLTAHQKASYKGQALPDGPSYVSTTYVNRGGKWTPVFHQETMGMMSNDAAMQH